MTWKPAERCAAPEWGTVAVPPVRVAASGEPVFYQSTDTVFYCTKDGVFYTFSVDALKRCIPPTSDWFPVPVGGADSFRPCCGDTAPPGEGTILCYLLSPPPYNAKLSRFDARYWHVDGPLSAISTIIADTPYELSVFCEFHRTGDLTGVLWTSLDRYDHPLFAYEEDTNYSGLKLAFVANPAAPYSFSLTLRVDTDSYIYRLYPFEIVGASLVPKVSDPFVNGAGPGTSYSAALLFPRGLPALQPGESIFVVDFDDLRLGFLFDGPTLSPSGISELMLSLTPPSYDPNASEDVAIGRESLSFLMREISVSGAGERQLNKRDYPQSVNGLSLCSGYDDTYNVTPWRQVNNLYGLGYRGSMTLYIGMAHWFSTRSTGSSDTYRRTVDPSSPAFNGPTTRWCQDLFKLLAEKGLGLVLSISYEVLADLIPPAWAQRDSLDVVGHTGWSPPSAFLIPAMPACVDYLSAAFLYGMGLMETAGLPLRVQIGEPWWWDGAYGPSGVCIYGDFVKTLYYQETGQYAQTPYIHDRKDPFLDIHKPYVSWLSKKLGDSTRAIKDAIKVVYPDAQVSLLFFSPQILGASELIAALNFPVAEWSYPAFDFMQTEDYDWIIAGQDSLLPQTTELATRVLGYPLDKVEYFVGFVLQTDYVIWDSISRAIGSARNRGVKSISIWAYPQVLRDAVVMCS